MYSFYVLRKRRRKRREVKKEVNVPVNKALYSRVKAEAKRKFKVYPSAYANAWLVREYKKTWRYLPSGEKTWQEVVAVLPVGLKKIGLM